MTSKLAPGDLAVLEITEHEADPKRYALIGIFKGSKKRHILARVGEGVDDPRPPELIRLTAERLGGELRALYTSMAHARAIQAREAATAAPPEPLTPTRPAPAAAPRPTRRLVIPKAAPPPTRLARERRQERRERREAAESRQLAHARHRKP